MSAEPHEERLDEGQPLPFDDEHEAPQFATVKLVEVQRGEGWAQDTAWHNELQAGMTCPQCYLPAGAQHKERKNRLKRHRNTVFCAFCKKRWWSRRST